MSKKRDDSAGYAKLLDAWNPPQGAGPPIGCLATTFTFQSSFFEEHCLARFLNIESDPTEESIPYLIEREEKLAQVACASVMVDAHHCKGMRNLRWDVIPFRSESGSLLHAKISLLYRQKHLRLIVSSANLTADGYRINREVFGVFDYFKGSAAPLHCLRTILDYLTLLADRSERDEPLSSPAIQRWRSLLVAAQKVPKDWGQPGTPTSRKHTRVEPILTSPGRPSVFEQFSRVWPGQTIRNAYVTSPFYDKPENGNLPAQKIWDQMAQRGEAWVTYSIEANKQDSGGWVFNAPKTIFYKPDRPGMKVVVERLAEVPRPEKADYRPLHMKRLWFDDEGDWEALIIGSSNFTSRGLGLIKRCNYEANLAYIVHSSANKDGSKALWAAYPAGEEIVLDAKCQWDPSATCGEDEPEPGELILPWFFRCAVYAVDDKGASIVQLSFDPNTAAEQGWSIRLPEGTDEFYGEQEWLAAGKPGNVRLEWSQPAPPSGFLVTWKDTDNQVWWPVEVEDASSLPPPAELRELSLEDLIAILTSARPLHEVLGKRRVRRPLPGDGDPSLETDPHRRVDVSGFLLQRTRRISRALTALRERLEQPVPTEESLKWRLFGPVGVLRMAEAILKEAHSDEERGFLIAELSLELASAKASTGPRCLPVERIKDAIGDAVKSLQEMIQPADLAHVPDIKSYVEEAMARAKV